MQSKRTQEEILKDYGQMRQKWKAAEHEAFRCAVRIRKINEKIKTCVWGTKEHKKLESERDNIRNAETEVLSLRAWYDIRLTELREEMCKEE